MQYVRDVPPILSAARGISAPILRRGAVLAHLPLGYHFELFFLGKLLLPWSARMLAQPNPQKKSAFKNPVLYSGAALAIAALLVVGILFSRWQKNRGIEKRANEERTQKQQEQHRRARDQLGGKDLAIQNFYASPAEIRRGGTA